MARGESTKPPMGERLRGENRGIVSVAAIVALLVGVTPILLGTGRAPSAIETLRSTAWFGRADGDLVQVNGTNGEQLFVLEDDGGPRARVLEDGTLVYVLEDGQLRVIDSSSRRKLRIEGDPDADQMLVNDRSVWLLDSASGRLAWAAAGSPEGTRPILFRTADGGAPVLGRAGLDPAGVAWVPDGKSRVRRVVRARTAATYPVPGTGELHVVVVGGRAVAVRTEAGQARPIGREEAGAALGLGAGVNRPLEDQPEGALYVSRTDGSVVRAPLTSGDVTSEELPGEGETTAPVVARGGVVVVRGTQLFLLDRRTLEVINRRDLGDVDPANITLRTRDGIAYVLDGEADLGAVVDGRDIHGVDLRPDGSVPSARTADPGQDPPPVRPPPDGFGPDLLPLPGSDDGDPGRDGPGGTDPGDSDSGDRDPGDGDPGDRDPDPEPPTSCTYGASGVTAAADGVPARVSVTWRQQAVPAACRSEGATVFASLAPDGGGAARTGQSKTYVDVGAGASDTFPNVAAGSWTVTVVVVVDGTEVARSAPSRVTVAQPGPEPPGTPTEVAVAVGDGSLDVTWQPPSGGADSYRAVVVGGAQQETSGTSARFTDLSNGTTYQIQVYGRRGGVEGPPALAQGTPEGPAVTVTAFDAAAPGFGSDAELRLDARLSDGTRPGSCTVSYRSLRTADADTVDVAGCSRLVVGSFSSRYEVTLVAVDGQQIGGLPRDDDDRYAETNRLSMFALRGGPLTYTNPVDTVTIEAGRDYVVECRTAIGFRSFGDNGAPGEIPRNAEFDNSLGYFEIIQRLVDKLPTC